MGFLLSQDLIDVYLYPMIKDKKKEERDAAGLKELRNRISVAFLLLNTIFVVVVFVMQLNMDVIYIPWPCGDNVKVEPIGFMFMMTFGIIMIVQIIGMLTHRMTTFLHIMATTMLPCGASGEDNKVEAMVDLAKRLGKLDELQRITLRSLPGSVNTMSSNWGSLVGDDIQKVQKRAVYQIDKNARRKTAAPMSLGRVFEERFKRLERGMDDDNPDLNELQKKLLGGATAGFFANRKTGAALKTYRDMRETVRGGGGGGGGGGRHDDGAGGGVGRNTVVRVEPTHSAAAAGDDYSADYSTSTSDGGTYRGEGRGVTFDLQRDEGHRNTVGRRTSARAASFEVPEADYY